MSGAIRQISVIGGKLFDPFHPRRSEVRGRLLPSLTRK
jgi:hypothetical protein